MRLETRATSRQPPASGPNSPTGHAGVLGAVGEEQWLDPLPTEKRNMGGASCWQLVGGDWRLKQP
jgi:hypothetical protein